MRLGRSIQLFAAVTLATVTVAGAASAEDCKTMRKINIGVSVAPPNVVHTSPYVAKALGLFAKHCVDATIIQFEGGQSATSRAAASQGTALVSVSDVSVGRGAKVRQIWGLAPRMPQAYTVAADIKTAADLKGRKLNASGGGVGGFNWRMGRELLKTAGLKVEDAQFISAATAGRLTGLIAGQIDGVALHPEDLYLAQQKKPGLHALAYLAELMPEYMFNAYGGAVSWIEKDHDLMVDTVAAMIEANRAIYHDRDKVVPIIMQATAKPREAVEYAWKIETERCVWSVNEGFDRKRTEWTIANDVADGFIKADHKPTFDQVVDMKIASEAVAKAGGRVTIGKCSL